jgi:hypothetical protein
MGFVSVRELSSGIPSTMVKKEGMVENVPNRRY